MHMYAKCDQNIQSGSRVMSILTECYQNSTRSSVVKCLDFGSKGR